MLIMEVKMHFDYSRGVEKKIPTHEPMVEKLTKFGRVKEKKGMGFNSLLWFHNNI